MWASPIGRLGLLVATLLAADGARATVQAQEVVVHGTVLVGETTQPIASATITVKGTRLGTQTNEQGAFTLRVPTTHDTLVVLRIGYARLEVPINGQTTLEIRMTATAVTLTQMVVVGYGAQKRSDITGSVSSVPTTQLEEKPNTNIAQALEGSLPGVTVSTTGAGAEPSLDILVRGRNSISASTAPLVVLDGIPYNGGLSDLNSDDIESIEVLKDASATAIYGSRGSNGVLLVTSKKGVLGKARVRYTGYTGLQRIANLPRLMNAQEFADFKCVRMRTTPTQSCDDVLTATEKANLQAGVNTDWLNIGMQTGHQQSHDLSYAGGSADTRYFVGGSVLDVTGVARNDRFNRATGRVNLDQNVKSWLSVGTSTQAAHVNRNGMPVSFANAFSSNPLISPYDAQGNELLVPWPDDPITNNVLENLRVVDEDQSNRLFSSNYLQLAIPRINGLTYRLNAGVDLASHNTGRYYGRNTQTGLTVGGTSHVYESQRTDWTLENLVRYNHIFGKSSIDLTGLLSEASSSLDEHSTDAQGFPNDVLAFRSNLPLLEVPSYTVTDSKLFSQMGRINYSYDERYLTTFTARRDGYSGFGTNNKWGVFPSAAFAWNVSNESFFPWKERVDALKLRYSVGKNGNQAIRPYQTFGQLDDRSYVDGTTSLPGYIPSTLGNPDLKWETTVSHNVGVDLSMYHDRFRVTLDAYSSRTSDLLLRRSISSVQGIGSVIQNIGKTANKGIELALGLTPVQKGDLTWRSDFNIAANRNRIVDLYGDQTDDLANGWFIGHPIDVNYGYVFDGVWQTADDIANSAQPTAKPGDVRVKDVNGDGKIDPLDRTIIGSLQPSYTAGWNNSLRFRGLTLSAFVNTVQGVTRANDLLSTNQVFTDVRRNMVYRTWWTPENPINTYPANSNTSNPFALPFYEDASFIRLKDLTLSYDVPTRLTSRLGGETVRVYVNGRNLWTHTKWTGLDPELNNQRAVPLQKVFTTGVTLGF
ncbi:MAG TPA: TonB-dependent receptor [Gemmatimonadaceae bacterium]|jgi:TonB-linked SusC/RagA family outer membrane protein